MEIKRCPFCGGNNFEITSRKIYDAVLDDHGGACISIRCLDCHTEKYDHNDSVRKYEDKVKALIDAWNTRVGEEE